jgi:hypothetical protein
MANIEDAIKAINPDAYFRCKPADSTAGITWENCEPISAEVLEAKKAELNQAEADAKAQKIIDKASGNQKMLDLGLSQAEVDALIGI